MGPPIGPGGQPPEPPGPPAASSTPFSSPPPGGAAAGSQGAHGGGGVPPGNGDTVSRPEGTATDNQTAENANEQRRDAEERAAEDELQLVLRLLVHVCWCFTNI